MFILAGYTICIFYLLIIYLLITFILFILFFNLLNRLKINIYNNNNNIKSKMIKSKKIKSKKSKKSKMIKSKKSKMIKSKKSKMIKKLVGGSDPPKIVVEVPKAELPKLNIDPNKQLGEFSRSNERVFGNQKKPVLDYPSIDTEPRTSNNHLKEMHKQQRLANLKRIAEFKANSTFLSNSFKASPKVPTLGQDAQKIFYLETAKKNLSELPALTEKQKKLSNLHQTLTNEILDRHQHYSGV